MGVDQLHIHIGQHDAMEGRVGRDEGMADFDHAITLLDGVINGAHKNGLRAAPGLGTGNCRRIKGQHHGLAVVHAIGRDLDALNTQAAVGGRQGRSRHGQVGHGGRGGSLHIELEAVGGHIAAGGTALDHGGLAGGLVHRQGGGLVARHRQGHAIGKHAIEGRIVAEQAVVHVGAGAVGVQGHDAAGHVA